VLRGAWLVSDTWLLHSLEAATLLPEDRFETTAFAGAKMARELREAGRPVCPLRGKALAIVEADVEAHERLRLLATAAGATLSTTTRAELWVGSGPAANVTSARSTRRRAGGATVVSEQWLYDCVSNCATLDPEPYASASA
jgi:hypothetical protein